MNTTHYQIRTAYGDWYELDIDGHVLKHTNGLDKTNAPLSELETWKITGAVRFNNFGYIVETKSLTELAQVSNERSLRYKNNNPIWTMIDIDHGTRRIQGNVKSHGIWLIRVAPEAIV